MSDSVLLSLLPVNPYWCYTDFPHMTLCWAGKDMSDDDIRGLLKASSRVSLMLRKLTLDTAGTEVFGVQGEKVSVLLVEPTDELLAARAIVEEWSASQHDFSPHVTLGPVGDYSELPERIEFDRLELRFDKVKIRWDLRSPSQLD